MIAKNSRWNNITIYNRVLELCEEKEMGIIRLSSITGINPSTFYTYRRRKSMPSIETLVAICNALNISLSEFFCAGEEDSKNVLFVLLDSISQESRELLIQVAKRME